MKVLIKDYNNVVNETNMNADGLFQIIHKWFDKEHLEATFHPLTHSNTFNQRFNYKHSNKTYEAIWYEDEREEIPYIVELDEYLRKLDDNFDPEKYTRYIFEY